MFPVVLGSWPPRTSSFLAAAYNEYARLGAESFERCFSQRARYWQGIYAQGAERQNMSDDDALVAYERCELRSHLSW